MKEIEKLVIERAIRNLEAAGCKFAVVDPAGNVFGELQVVAKKKGAPKIKRNNFKKTGYIDKVKGMKVGDVLVIDAGEFVPEEFRKSIAGVASSAFGNDCATTAINGHKIEIMRLG